MRVAAALTLALALATGGGCRDTSEAEPSAPADPVEVLTVENDAGPLVATVTLSPKAPRIGDVLTLRLKVVADPSVRITMPPFGEALGRFTVLKYTPRQGREADGRSFQEQTYTLQAPGSGRQRIPQLRIAFVTADSEQERELLTDELPVDIESVVAATEISNELSGVPGSLDESPGLPIWLWPTITAALLFFGLWWWRAHRARRAREALAIALGAYDRALDRLAALSARGTPSEQEADDWYVELSHIVRRYLEDRQRLRAPELTTEEFLTRAQHTGELGDGPRDLLPEFLAQCDRVKFAAYRPTEEESQRGLELARLILEQQEEFLVAEESRDSGGAS